MRPRKHVAGSIVGRFVLIHDEYLEDGRKRVVRAQCGKCGVEVIARIDNLTNSRSRVSCACNKR